MGKKRISKEQEFCFQDMPALGLKKNAEAYAEKPSEFFKDHNLVASSLLDCLIENDTEAFIEILDAYLMVNRSKVAKQAHLARSTVQLALSKKGNPTLKTLAKIIHEAVA